MRFVFCLALAAAANAATIVQTGDSLAFTISERSFAVNCAQLGGPAAPTGILFQLVTDPLAVATQFDATLESADGSVSVSLGSDLSFAPGTFQGTYSSGPVSVLSGAANLPETLSQQLFAGSQAVLVLRNDGPAVDLGLAPYTLAEELQVSLGGSDFSVGALDTGAALGSQEDDPVPEPPNGPLLGVIGGLFLGVGWGLKRISRARIQ